MVEATGPPPRSRLDTAWFPWAVVALALGGVLVLAALGFVVFGSASASRALAPTEPAL